MISNPFIQGTYGELDTWNGTPDEAADEERFPRRVVVQQIKSQHLSEWFSL